MSERQPPSPTEAANRRGCLVLVAIVAVALMLVTYFGLSADPIDDVNSAIPTLS